MNRPDFTLADHGSVALLHQNNDAARAWVGDNVGFSEWQVLGSAIACEPRTVPGLLDLLTEAGFTVEVS